MMDVLPKVCGPTERDVNKKRKGREEQIFPGILRTSVVRQEERGEERLWGRMDGIH